MIYRSKNFSVIPETDLRFLRVDVDIDEMGRNADRKNQKRVTALHKHGFVGFVNGGRNGFRADDTVIDVDRLLSPVPACNFRFPYKAGEVQIIVIFFNRNTVLDDILAVDGEERRGGIVVPGAVKKLFSLTDQTERNVRPYKRKTLHELCDILCLCGILL